MKHIVALAALALAACNGRPASERAIEELEFLEANGASRVEVCAATHAVADAYRDERNGEEFSLWRQMALIRCDSTLGHPLMPT